MRRTARALTILILGGTLLYAALSLSFGAPAASDMDDYFIGHGQEQTGANNIVTAVVFDYRGFDTLGEATVLFAAVLGIGLLFRKLSAEEDA